MGRVKAAVPLLLLEETEKAACLPTAWSSALAVLTQALRSLTECFEALMFPNVADVKATCITPAGLRPWWRWHGA